MPDASLISSGFRGSGSGLRPSPYEQICVKRRFWNRASKFYGGTVINQFRVLSGEYFVLLDFWRFWEFLIVFTALHALTRSSHEKSCLSVCPSVCPSACQTRGFWQKEKSSAHIFIPYERTFILVLWEEKWLVGATTFTWTYWSNWHCWSEIADFQSIFAHSVSALTPSKKFNKH